MKTESTSTSYIERKCRGGVDVKTNKLNSNIFDVLIFEKKCSIIGNLFRVQQPSVGIFILFLSFFSLGAYGFQR